jgi:5-oxopent-3-ene-1,2,5-tricarboxylate decarboxylase/2-hydroxyhepta-2,4-diene-1,7-dioate isomerase
MKHARISYQGVVHEATERDGQLLLADGRLLPFDDVSWLPPLAPTPRPRTIFALGLIVGRTARNVKRADAYDFIGGYTVANDYAIRDYLENWYRPNLRVKNRDATTPIGPWYVDAADVPNPMALALSTTVNGKVTQSGNTKDMIFDVPFLIEFFSGFMTLQPGDLILTGTPDGVVDCRPGDVIVTEIDGIGALVNTIE